MTPSQNAETFINLPSTEEAVDDFTYKILPLMMDGMNITPDADQFKRELAEMMTRYIIHNS